MFTSTEKMATMTAHTMESLIEQARSEGKWLFTAYQGLWFSPDELVAKQANGHFRWGPTNWKLRDPQEHLAELAAAASAATRDADSVRKRISGT